MKVLKNFSTIVIALLIIFSSFFFDGIKSEAKTKQITMFVDQREDLHDYFGYGIRCDSISKNKLVELDGSYLVGKKKGKKTIKLYTSGRHSKESVHKLKLNVKKNPLKYEMQDLPYHILGDDQATMKFTNTSNKFISAIYKFRFYDSDGAFTGHTNINTGVIFPKQTVYIDFQSFLNEYDLSKTKVERSLSVYDKKPFKMKDCTDKVKVEITQEREHYYKMLYKSSYTGNKDVYVNYYYTKYDSEGHVAGHGKEVVVLTKDEPIAKRERIKENYMLDELEYYVVYDYYRAYHY